MINDIENLRAFKISFLSPTNQRGSRVKIEDLRHEKKLIISYDYEFNNIKDIAEKVLSERGIKIKYSCESKDYYILLSEDFTTQIKEEKPLYSVNFDNGKPYSENYFNETDLKQGLKEFYERNKDDDYPFTAEVFNDKGEDITESQFINEIVGDFLDE